jgi:hypothetical protein
VLLPDYRPVFPFLRGGIGPGVSRSHLISAAELGCSVPTLCRYLYLVAISQWFVHLSAHPQLMK